MGKRLDIAKRYHKKIREILLREWDPIGVADVPEAQDEYDDYIYQIYGYLIRREPRDRLFEFLWWAETEHIGLFGNRQRTDAVTDRILRLPGEIESEN